MFARIKAWLFSSSREPARSTGAQALHGAITNAERPLGRAQMQLAQAHADYQAAKQLWPRDRKAVDRAWRQFRDARCAQISAEIGR